MESRRVEARGVEAKGVEARGVEARRVEARRLSNDNQLSIATAGELQKCSERNGIFPIIELAKSEQA